MTRLRLEMQSVADNQLCPGLLITPQIDESYWTFRVVLSARQAIVCFPKFTGFGIGFQQEDDWNTNLPYTCTAEQIYRHIRHNQGDASIKKPTVLAAIRLCQQAVKTMRKEP